MLLYTLMIIYGENFRLFEYILYLIWISFTLSLKH